MGDVYNKQILCGDCGARDPQWGALNRGLLLCSECCFIHRSLGPQCTRVKSLFHSQWHPNQKKMLMTLAGGSANHIWEHTLMDPSKADSQSQPTRKPTPTDSLEVVKRKFIFAKHSQFQFVLKQKIETFNERNQELHSTVRTSDLGTTLRLLASGADPNFFHPEKGTRPIHVAARTGQALQVELLFLHGAHTDSTDYLGQTAVEHAMSAGFKELSQRILQLRYFLTDQLSLYVCDKLSDHATSKHIIIPPLKFRNVKLEAEIANLPPHVIQQLATDLYDEVDRRQLEKEILDTCHGSEASKFSIAFLPVQSHFSSVRNQARQKYARLANDELTSFITTLLTESKRRHCNDGAEVEGDQNIFLSSDPKPSSFPEIKNLQPVGLTTVGILEDDDYPLYDSVATDEDIASEQQSIINLQKSVREESVMSNSSAPKPSTPPNLTDDKSNALTAKIIESEAKIRELEDSNQNLKFEIMILQRMIGGSIHENLSMRSNPKLKDVPQSYGTVEAKLVNGHNNGALPNLQRSSSLKDKPPRPVSLCETKNAGNQPPSHLLPPRPNTTEMFPKNNKILRENAEVIQDSTRKIVELIKVMVEYANILDMTGVELTSGKIFDEVQVMVDALVQKGGHKNLEENLENTLLQALRMKTEILILNEAERGNGNTKLPVLSWKKDKKEGITAQEFVLKVKQICFELGAAMKKLVFSVQQHGPQ